METVYSNRDGHQMKTVIPMLDIVTESQRMSGDKGEPQLHITTSKSSRGISTNASVMLVALHSCSHVFPSDYMKSVSLSPARATEKAIRAQHDAALTQTGALLAEVRAFYAAKT